MKIDQRFIEMAIGLIDDDGDIQYPDVAEALQSVHDEQQKRIDDFKEYDRGRDTYILSLESKIARAVEVLGNIRRIHHKIHEALQILQGEGKG